MKINCNNQNQPLFLAVPVTLLLGSVINIYNKDILIHRSFGDQLHHAQNTLSCYPSDCIAKDPEGLDSDR